MLLLKGPIFQTAEGGGFIFRRPKFLSAERGIKRADILKCRFEDVLIFRRGDVSMCRVECFYFSRRGNFFQSTERGWFLYFRNAVVSKCRAGFSYFLQGPFFNMSRRSYFARSDILNYRSAKFLFFGEEFRIPARQCSHFFQGTIF